VDGFLFLHVIAPAWVEELHIWWLVALPIFKMENQVHPGL
jgi:hypothetical protein